MFFLKLIDTIGKKNDQKYASMESVTSKITLYQSWCLFCKFRAKYYEDMMSEWETLLGTLIYIQKRESIWRMAF